MRYPLSRLARWRDIVVKQLCFLKRSTALSATFHDQHAIHPLKANVQSVARLDHVTGLADDRIVYPNQTGLDIALGNRSGFGHASKEQPLVQTLARTFR